MSGEKKTKKEKEEEEGTTTTKTALKKERKEKRKADDDDSDDDESAQKHKTDTSKWARKDGSFYIVNLTTANPDYKRPYTSLDTLFLDSAEDIARAVEQELLSCSRYSECVYESNHDFREFFAEFPTSMRKLHKREEFYMGNLPLDVEVSYVQPTSQSISDMKMHTLDLDIWFPVLKWDAVRRWINDSVDSNDVHEHKECVADQEDARAFLWQVRSGMKMKAVAVGYSARRVDEYVDKQYDDASKAALAYLSNFLKKIQ